MSTTYATRSRNASPATPKQIALLHTLAAERGVECPAFSNFGQASAAISALIAMPKAPKAAKPAAAGRTFPALPDVPAGHYATRSRTGNNDLDFWTVDRPTKGKWAGRTFVDRVVGGHDDIPVRGAEARTALEAIAAAGIAESATLYGQEIGQCARCNRSLTDFASRWTGFGPDCRSIVGVTVTAAQRAEALAWALDRGLTDLIPAA